MTKLLTNESPLQVLPKLAAEIGLNEAIVLQQVHYWITNPNAKKSVKTVLGQRWVKNSFEGWKENFPFWHVQTIKRIFLNLEKDGYLVSGHFNRTNGLDRTKWYTIDYDKLSPITEALQRVDPEQNEVATRLYQNDTMEEQMIQSCSQNEAELAEQTDPDCIKVIPPSYQNDTTLIDSVIDSNYTTTTTAHDACEGEPVQGRAHEGDWFTELTEDFQDLPLAEDEPEQPRIEIDPALGKIKTTCELHGLWLNPTLSAKIDDIYDEISPPDSETRLEWFEYAVAEAATTDSRPRWALIETIMRGVQASGSLVIHKANRIEQKILTAKRDKSGDYNGNYSNDHRTNDSGKRTPSSQAAAYCAANDAAFDAALARKRR